MIYGIPEAFDFPYTPVEPAIDFARRVIRSVLKIGGHAFQVVGVSPTLEGAPRVVVVQIESECVSYISPGSTEVKTVPMYPVIEDEPLKAAIGARVIEIQQEAIEAIRKMNAVVMPASP